MTEQHLNIDWKSKATGIWSGKVPGHTVPLIEASGVQPRLSAIEQLGQVEVPLVLENILARRNRHSLIVQTPLDEEEKLYGIGLRFNSINARCTVSELRADHYAGKDTGGTHAPVPVYWSSRGYGVMVNVSAPVKVYAGTSHPTHLEHPPIHDRRSPDWRPVSPSKMVEFAIPAEGVEIIVFGGPTLKRAIQRFNLYCGGGCLPPKWGLGFWHRTPLQYTADDCRKEVKAFIEQDFPLDVLGLEPGWHSSSYPTTFEWNTEAFPDPEGLVNELLEKDVRLNLWENPMVHPHSPAGEAVKEHSLDYYAGWGGVVPDFSLQEARDAIATQHGRAHVDIGVSGYKLDECDGYDRWLWPDHAIGPSGLSGDEMRQQCGLQFQRLTTELFASKGKRTYGQVRATNAGAQSFPYVLYNDCYDHREYICGIVNSGFCGTLFTPEARKSATSEDWLRRIQATCLSPLAQLNGWADGTKPWSFPEVTHAVRDVIRLRAKLLPYLYTAFARYQQEGIPPFRGLMVDGLMTSDAPEEQGELDSTDNPYNAAADKDIADQYLVGEDLMVAPLFAGEPSRTVVLPKGIWCDFYTGEVLGGEKVITVEASFEHIPLYVKAGTCLPMVIDPTTDTQQLEVICYGMDVSNTCEGWLYDDAGDGFAYKDGFYVWQHFKVTNREAPLEGTVQNEGNYSSDYQVLRWKDLS